MKTIFSIPMTSIHLSSAALLALTATVCLAAIQSLGVDASLPIATAASLLAFCSRQRVASTWDLLMHVHTMRTSGIAR